MDTIYSWTAQRAGPTITVTGRLKDGEPKKLTNVAYITVDDHTGAVLAVIKDGPRYRLSALRGSRP